MTSDPDTDQPATRDKLIAALEAAGFRFVGERNPLVDAADRETMARLAAHGFGSWFHG